MSLACRICRPFVMAAAADGSDLPEFVAGHHDRCLRCQAFGARTRATVRELRSLSSEMVPEMLGGSPDARRAGLLAPVAAGAAVTVALLVVRRRLLSLA